MEKKAFKVGSAPWETGSAPQAFKVGEAPWESGSQNSVNQKPRESSAAQAALEGFGQGALLGYLPQVQAIAEPVTDRLFNMLPGPDVKPASMKQMVPGSQEYIKARDANIQRQKELSQAHPTASVAGQATGILATSLIPGGAIARGAKTAGTMAKIGRGAIVGGVEAGLMNPGDTEGEFNPLQVAERLDNAKTGALFGAGAGVASKAISSGVAKSKDLAEKVAFKSSGAMLKDFRKAAEKAQVNELGRFMLDRILKSGDSFDDVAQKAEAIRQQAGKDIGGIYSSVLKKVGDEKFWNNLDPAKKSALAMTGFKPVGQKEEIIKIVDDALGDSPNKKAAVSFITEYVDDLGKKYGNDLDLVKSNNIKSTIDKAINYGKRVQDLPEKQEALYALRNYIRDRNEDHIQVLDDIVGGSQVKDLRTANKLFGSASEIEGIAFDRVQRESANRFFSLGDRITGAAGMAGGAATGAMVSGDVEGAIKGATLGLGGAAASKVVRKYGPHAAARALDATSKATGLGAVPGMVTSSGVRAAGAPKYESATKKDQTQPELNIQGLAASELDRNSGVPSNQEAPAQPLRGKEKWANDGFNVLKEHARIGDDPRLKEHMLSDPKLREMLIQASDLKPGSKAMENLANKMRNHMRSKYGEKK